jgi:hypothetical protein
MDIEPEVREHVERTVRLVVTDGPTVKHGAGNYQIVSVFTEWRWGTIGRDDRSRSITYFGRRVLKSGELSDVVTKLWGRTRFNVPADDWVEAAIAPHTPDFFKEN